MTVENIYSEKATNFRASPQVMLDARGYGGRIRRAVDYVATTGTTTTSGSTYKCLPLPSNAIIRSLSVISDGVVDLPNLDFGAVTEGDLYLDDDSIATAKDTTTSGKVYAIDPTVFVSEANHTKRLWQFLDSAVTEDPGGIIFIHLSLDADAVAAGTLMIEAEYVVGA